MSDFFDEVVVCPTCGREFRRTGPNQGYCDWECAYEALMEEDDE